MNDLTKTNDSPLWFKAILLIGMLLFAFYASTHMVAAGDTWVAMACGRHFANHGVDTVEPFSFNSHPAGPSDKTLEKFPEGTHGLIRKWHPTGWINQNWLTHMIFYKLATWFGEGDNYNWNMLVYWKFALYFMTVLIVYATGRLIGLTSLLAAAAACFAMVIGRSFYDIRPAGYSNMLVPALILIMAVVMYRNYRWIWLVVPLVVFWANVHGGYIYAFIMLAPFIAINLLLRLPRRWTLSLGFIGLWLLMYIMSHQFITHNYYLTVQKILRTDLQEVSLLNNNLFWTWILLTIGSLALTVAKKIPPALFYLYHFGIGAIYFLSLLIRFLPEYPKNLTNYFDEIYSYFVHSSLMSFLFVFIAGTCLISAMSLKKHRFLALPPKGVFHAVGASAVALVVMVILNPFHLTNLTHTFEISVSKHAESWRQVREWKPAFDWMDKTTAEANPVGNEEAFAMFCFLTLTALLVWLSAYLITTRINKQPAKKSSPKSPPVDACSWSKINLALVVVALLTIYMGIKSRRFIAIAGSAAGPFVFLFFKETFANIPRKVNTVLTIILIGISIFFISFWNILFSGFDKLDFSWQARLVVEILILSLIGSLYFLQKRENSLHKMLRFSPALLFTLGIVILGGHWGSIYKRVYLDPWPNDPYYNSVFMRMTASNLKPIQACEFLKHNTISGKVFNYWTEGGAVALGQEPDEKTGHIPLKLFMDGRAQAAYNHDKFRLWQDIFSGGQIAQQARFKGKKITKEQRKQIGNQIEKRFGNDVWVVLMPGSQGDSIFMKSIKATGHWRTVYIDHIQHVMVNINTPKGKDLIDKLLKDELWFPNDYSKSLTTYIAISENRMSSRYPELYDLAKKVFDEYPHPSATITLRNLSHTPLFRERVLNDTKNYLEDFVQHQEQYKDEDGYLQSLSSARICADFLAGQHPQEKQQYETLSQALKRESNAVKERSIW